MSRAFTRGAMLALALGSVALAAPGLAAAKRTLPNPACGSTIYTSVTLHGNMNCPSSDGLMIGANKVTVNLNGFALVGDFTNDYNGIDNGGGFNRLTVENGTVENWENIAVYQDAGKNLSISNVHADDSPYGFYITDSTDGTITGSEASEDLDGAYFEDNHMVTLSNSTLSGNVGDGVDDDNSLDTLSGDTTEHNDGDGVYVDKPLTVSSPTGQLYYSILNSTSSYNNDDGFEIEGNSPTTLYQARVRGNTAEFNGASGTGWGYYAFQQVKGFNNGALGNASGNCFHVPCHNISP